MSFAGIFDQSAPALGPLIADAVIDEQHERVGSWTSLRVEDGATLSDHFELRQRRLPVRFMIASIGGETLGLDRDRHLRARDQLDEMIASASLYTLILASGEFVNMGLESYRWPRDTRNANTLMVTTVWVQVEFGQTQSFESFAEGAVDQGLAEVDLGAQGFGEVP